MHTGHVFWFTAVALLIFCGWAFPQETERWTEEEAWIWYNRQPWLCGFNYVPSTASNTTEFWSEDTFDETTIARELGWARNTGFNSCRVFIQYQVWKADPEGFRQRLGRFLEIADANDISVVPTLFDDCTFGDPPLKEPFPGKQREPIPGMILPSWTPSPGLSAVTDHAVWPDLERYVKDLVVTFARDRRILFWDIYNEPGNSGMGDTSLPLAEAAFDWARAAHPEQPLTIAVWSGMENMNRSFYEHSDIITGHAYTDLNGLKTALKTHRVQGRPVIFSEWMARPLGGNWETDLPFFKAERTGCYCLGIVNGKTQAQFSWKSRPGDPEPDLWFHDLFHQDGRPYNPAEVEVIMKVTGVRGVQDGAAHAPLYVDPVYDGAADPTLVWNRGKRAWWMFYTSRRANQIHEPGVRWCHGTDIGIAVSPDCGHTWNYRGTARGLAFEPGQNSWWAPEMLWHNGQYHLFVSYVPGMHEDWSGKRHIIHYTGMNLLDWTFAGILPLSSERVIDPCLYHFPNGTWRMWYKDEADQSHIYLAESDDLFTWKVTGPAETTRGQEAPNLFRLGGYYWMLTDSGGMHHYRSEDGLAWKDCGSFMWEPGTRPDDNYRAQHPDVVVLENTAYIIHFVHPFGERHTEPDKHRSVIQVAKLEVRDGALIALREEPFTFDLMSPRDGKYHGEK